MILREREYRAEKYATMLWLRPERDMVRAKRPNADAYYRDVLRRWLARLLERHYSEVVTAGEARAIQTTDVATNQRYVRAWVYAAREVKPEDQPTVTHWLSGKSPAQILRVPALDSHAPSA